MHSQCIRAGTSQLQSIGLQYILSLTRLHLIHNHRQYFIHFRATFNLLLLINVTCMKQIFEMEGKPFTSSLNIYPDACFAKTIRIGKWAVKTFGISYQWRSNLFLIVIFHFSLVQAAMNFYLQHLNWFSNWKIKNKEALKNYKGLSEDGGGGAGAKIAEWDNETIFLPDPSCLTVPLKTT